MTVMDTAAATTMIRPFAQILASMTSLGVTGMASKCSMVPCSLSRIKAAPVKITDSMVILLMICITDVNHSDFRFGLNMTRNTKLTGRSAAPPALRT